MDRRNFIRLGALGAAAGIIAPDSILATPMDTALTKSMAGGVFYTKDAPGRWSKKVAGHLPIIETTKSDGGVKLLVTTPHEMRDYEHYIVKHIVLNQKFEFVDETLFDPKTTQSPVSSYLLDDYQGPVHVLSVCNKHDSWLNIATV